MEMFLNYNFLSNPILFYLVYIFLDKEKIILSISYYERSIRNMKKLLYIILIAGITACSLGEKSSKNNSKNRSVTELKSPIGKAFGFYNVENLFDTIDNKYTLDEDFLPDSKKQWNTKKYFEKLNNLAKVITAIDNKFPMFIGFAEIENKLVIEDLLSNTNLKDGNYGIVHHESPDRRGIDLGLIYQKDYINIVKTQKIQVEIDSEPDFATRDIIYIKGEMANNDMIHIFLNHWSSRRGGQQESEYKRVRAAAILRNQVDILLEENPLAKILIMGDFNDYPTNKSLYVTLNAAGTPDFQNGQLFNMAYKLEKEDKGTYNYKGEWGMLDQMIVSKGLYASKKGVEVSYDKCLILKEDWMLYTDQKNGDQKPSRSYGGPQYFGGYSDHLPIYSRFKD